MFTTVVIAWDEGVDPRAQPLMQQPGSAKWGVHREHREEFRLDTGECCREGGDRAAPGWVLAKVGGGVRARWPGDQDLIITLDLREDVAQQCVIAPEGEVSFIGGHSAAGSPGQDHDGLVCRHVVTIVGQKLFTFVMITVTRGCKSGTITTLHVKARGTESPRDSPPVMWAFTFVGVFLLSARFEHAQYRRDTQY